MVDVEVDILMCVDEEVRRQAGMMGRDVRFNGCVKVLLGLLWEED